MINQKNMSAVKNVQPMIPFKEEMVAMDFYPPAAHMTMLGYKEGHKYQAYVPQKEENHKFSNEFMRVYRSFHNNPGQYGLAIVGPTGSGKSTSILACNHFLNIPTVIFTGDEDTQRADLVGTMKLKTNPATGQTETVFVYGLLLMAYKYGFTFVLEEFNLMDNAVLKSLNEIVRGSFFVVPDTKEVIQKHPMFRMIIVGNDWGRGNGGIREAGGQVSFSFLDRFMKLNMGYLSKEDEIEVIQMKYPNISEDLATGMVEVAHKIRPLIIGLGTDDANAKLDLDLSTRTLLSWADMVNRFPKAPCPLKMGLDIALLSCCAEFEKIVIEEQCRNVFGDLYVID